jgi:protein-S-isoprenylcysteine O-methyltransferase Ste14
VVTASVTFGAAALVLGRLSGNMKALGVGLSLSFVVGVERLVLETEATASLLSTVTRLAVRATCVCLGLGLLRWMHDHRHAAARAALHAAVFGSTLALLAPLVVLRAVGRTPARSAIALLLVTASLAIGLAAARAFARAGGTPDPLDPPLRLVTEGIYARARHPLQIAEALLLLGSAVAFWDAWVLVYALASVASLVGPLRLLEEAMLEHRFGDEAVRYRRLVPAFLPLTTPRASGVPRRPRTLGAR